MNGKLHRVASHFLAAAFMITALPAIAQNISKDAIAPTQNSLHIKSARKINPTTVELQLSGNRHMLLDFYGENIFRLFCDEADSSLRDPKAQPPAQILTDNPRKPVADLKLNDQGNSVVISTNKVTVLLDKSSTLMKIFDNSHKLIVQSVMPVAFENRQAVLKLKEHAGEYFYGGGVQNGRFSHKGKSIAIENQNSWTDGGVASPTPFYWSTNGYGFMWYTFKKGKYDFGEKDKDVVTLSHETGYLDVFFMVDEKPASLLSDFYQLTGHPILLPKFGFYEGHLNAYNRDYWKQDTSGILFEDGKRYKESHKDNGGIKESLNGEKNNYQFSARAVVDRYASHDLPLGWILPNDGYGAGYGQTSTLDSNIANLKSFGDYARQHGVQIGLWTQSDLHPKPGVSALLQRDIVKEVGVAGVRVLKTDVAWVGRGYSFGLNGVSDVAHIMSKDGDDARPFIISLDGWAGTQRYAGVWTGDQTGGEWEYIRFHIPTYIGSGLSGQPNITSDMDGIFGGGNPVVNTRDFQWKAFTPMQLNMDGWGANEKYPFALGEPATSINRTYLKLKSQLIPYTYSIAKEATNGLPMMRAMFLEYPNDYTHGKATQYQFMYGPYFLVAPIYKSTKADIKGNDIRNGIYLPRGKWIDYFSGEVYEGGNIINDFDAPIWKLPLFVKSGAIIPMANPNNHVSEIDKSLRIYQVYPEGRSSFTQYNDDGFTQAYKNGKGVTTLIESSVANNQAVITVHHAKGSFNGFVKNKTTEFVINVTQAPTSVTAKVGNRTLKLTKVSSKDDFSKGINVYFYDAAPDLNRFATKGSEFEKVVIRKNPQVLIKIEETDITANPVTVTVNGFRFSSIPHLVKSTGPLTAPSNVHVADSAKGAFSLNPSWSKVANADYYEIEFNDQQYTDIKDTSLLFEDLHPETNYSFKIRSVNKSGSSSWKTFSAKTKPNPLKFAIKGIVAESSVQSEEGTELPNFFDFDENDLWHTKWNQKAVPFDLVMDLMSVNQLHKIEYLPRGRGNGTWLKGKIFYSADKIHWNEADSFHWARTGEMKEFIFQNHPSARYIKITVSDAVGGYGSGRELYVFKVPGTESILPGDINNDHRLDRNDLTSYINYTGLRKGDGDFEGYISKGDVNNNGLIDAYDISNVATRLEGGVNANEKDSLAGKIEISTDKKNYEKGETVEIKVKGIDLNSVNALSFALPYNEQDFEFEGITPVGIASLENMTNDRLHTNGQKALYPTFVNVGDKKTLNGTMDLFIIKFKAKHKLNFNLKPIDGMLVDRHLNVLQF